jgi:TMEM175 potassium channel family protein
VSTESGPTANPADPYLSANRLETLGDGVFAIAMTVLVLGIQVPDVADASELWPHLVALWPKFASYALSFVMLGVLWIGHYYQFQYIRRTDRTLIWLNLLFLLMVTFLPFGAGVLGNSYRSTVAVALYGGTILAAGSALLLHWQHATRDRKLVVAELPNEVVATLRARIVVGLGFSAAAIAVGFIEPRISLGVFLVMPIPYMRRSRLERGAAAGLEQP